MLGQSVGGGVEGHGHGSDRAVCAREAVGWQVARLLLPMMRVESSGEGARGRVGEDACVRVCDWCVISHRDEWRVNAGRRPGTGLMPAGPLGPSEGPDGTRDRCARDCRCPSCPM